MLRKQYRITTAEFKRLGRPAYVLHTHFFSIRVHRAGGGVKKYAVVVSKKIEPTAVGRNRIRRRLYELLKERLAHFPEGNAAVIFAKKEAANASFAALKGTVVGLRLS